jgi:hypothetical protein
VNILIRALALGLDVNQALHNYTATHNAGDDVDGGGGGGVDIN